MTACLGLALPVFTADPLPASAEGLAITQAVEQTRQVKLTEVEKLPEIDVQISFVTGHGSEQASYTGALLWTLLGGAEPAGGTDPRMRLRHTIAVTGRDGYIAVLALAEIDPEFEGKQVILAYKKNGQPLDWGELRLVVPGDRRGGRSVRDVVRIDLR